MTIWYWCSWCDSVNTTGYICSPCLWAHRLALLIQHGHTPEAAERLLKEGEA